MSVSGSPRPAWAAGGAGLGLTAVYYLLPGGGTAQAVLYSAIGLAAAAALVLGARRNLPGRLRPPWFLLAIGVASFAGGDALFSYYEQTGEAPFPSAADGVYLAAYPLLFAGIVLLVLRVGARELRFALADALIVAGALAIVQWVFLMKPLATDESGLERAILLAYPAMDILLVAALARLLFTPAWRATAVWILAGAVLLQLVADELYLAYADTYVSGSWLDALWLVSYALFAAAGLHPSVRHLARTLPADPKLGWARVLLLGGALVSVPVALASRGLEGTELAAVAGLAAGLSVLVLLRIVDLVRALAAENERLRELDRLKDEFVGMVSHDLRTPLTSITGYVELLLDDEEGMQREDRRRFLAVVDRSARRLQRLVDDLLFETRLQAGRQELDLGEVDLAELGRGCVEESRPGADEAGIELVLEAPDPVTLVADGTRLTQLFDNLVSNALKFTPAGGRVAVSVAAAGPGGVLEVSDTGIGISPEEHARLFERFYRASNARRRELPGTGLGLHIAQAIVAAHGGTISVDSREGAGTTVRAELPLSPPGAGSGSRSP